MTLTPRTLARLAAASEVADMVERASEDADEYLIRVRLASPDDPGALPVGQVRRVAATRLLRDAGIAYRPTSVPLPGRMTGRTEMVLDYSEAPTRQAA